MTVKKQTKKLSFHFFLKLSVILVFFPYSQFVFGQSSLNKVKLINEYFPDKQSLIVKEKANVNDNIIHYSSFQAIAFPVANLNGENISLSYENEQFTVTIGRRNLTPDLPLWQLIPIVQFANSPYQSAYTPLGEVKKGEPRYKYHFAFLDNLLGLRLFQADLLNIPDVLWDIPRNEKGEYIMAESEMYYAPHKNQNISAIIYNTLDLQEKQFIRYILTDRNIDMLFGIEGNDLKFYGDPYYCFLQTEIDTMAVNRLRNEAEAHYKSIEENAMAFLKGKYVSKLNPRTNMAGLLKVLEANKSNEFFNPYNMHFIKNSLDKLEELNQLADEEMDLNRRNLEELSNSFREHWNLLKQYNPLVYTAIENISHWSAFFRYIRLTNPENWNSFVQKLENVKITGAPIVKTPTSYENVTVKAKTKKR
ncbi:MAG: hypothetical protein LBH32_04860 [Dysgonamonadaceae bacterium]|jgi:hypothetical protein|nr:hypothetical protein [Dysgonamonadaceae bacterium]